MKEEKTAPEDYSFPPVMGKPKESLGHREELVDHYWGSINYVFSLIKASEIKAGLILSFYGILLNQMFRVWVINEYPNWFE